MTLSHKQAVGLMVLATFLWGTAGVVTRQLETAQGFEITFWRSFFTLIALLIIVPLWQGKGLWQRTRQAGSAMVVSGVCWAVMFTAFMVGITLTTVANVLITMSLGPLFTALLARLVLSQRLPRRTWVAIVVAGAGIGWMYGVKIEQGEWLGTLVALSIPIAAAINWTTVQRSRASGHKVDLVPAVMLGALISTLAVLPLALPFTASAHDLWWLAGLGLGQLAIPCLLVVVCARVLSAPEVALLSLLEVLFGIALAWLGADEVPNPQVLLGGAVVLAALVGNEWLGWRERSVEKTGGQR